MQKQRMAVGSDIGLRDDQELDEALALGQFYRYAGESDRALDWLERCYDVRDANLPYLSSGHKIYDTVRTHPRYQALLRRMKLPI